MHLRRGSLLPETQRNTRLPIPRFMEEPIILEEQHQRALESYGTPSVIVNERYGILHVCGSAGHYLLQRKGPVTNDILTLVRPELQLELRTALFHASEQSRATVSHPVSVQLNGHRRRVVVSVRPLPDEPGFDNARERQALVLFIEDEVLDPDEMTAEADTPAQPGRTGPNARSTAGGDPAPARAIADHGRGV